MKVKHFTNKRAVQLLSTQSRRTDIGAAALCKVHFEMGKILAYEMLDEFELSEIEIQHVQGAKKGVQLSDKDNVVIFALMRAGLYAAEGVRSVLAESRFVLVNETADACGDLANKIVVIVDAVINTGDSVAKVIAHLQKGSPRKIIVGTLVMQKDAVRLADKYENVCFYALRISDNKYVGKGATDTGNRLFNLTTDS